MENLFWIGHASFYIKSEHGTVFIDPFNVSHSLGEKADMILITHAHFDHCSEGDIRKVMKKDTRIIAAPQCLEKRPFANITVAKPGFRKLIDGIKIEAIPAYNTSKERQQFHPKSNDWVGYILEIEGERLYHAGDTDFIREMGGIRPDIALLPIGGTYTMDISEASEAAAAIGAKTTIPMHYKNLLGREGSAKAEQGFKDKVDGARIMKEVQEPDYKKF